MKNIKNSFIALALCMVGNATVHGVNINNDDRCALQRMVDDAMLTKGMMTLMKVRQHKAGPSLHKVNKGPLQEIDKYMHDLSWQSNMCHVQTTMGNGNLPVVCIRTDDTVVAARIDDNRNGGQNENCVYSDQVKKLISDLQQQHGPQLPIQVHTPHRQAAFSGVTGKLYSDADTVKVYDSHDLAVRIKPGGTLYIGGGIPVICVPMPVKPSLRPQTIT